MTPMGRSVCSLCGRTVPVIEPGVHRKHRDAKGQPCRESGGWVNHSTYVYGDGTPHPSKVLHDQRLAKEATP